MIRDYFSDIPELAEVSRCESGFTHYLPDGSILQGRVDADDTGAMQINKRYHEARATEMGLDLDVLEDNLKYARYLYNANGLSPWKASQSCWSKHIAMI